MNIADFALLENPKVYDIFAVGGHIESLNFDKPD